MIICIIGKTGTGKSTIAKELSKELGIPLIVSHTSRPMRSNEINGKDYYFVYDEYFEKHKSEFIDLREYTVANGCKWKYGIHKKSIKRGKDYIAVVDVIGFENLSKHYNTRAIILESDNDLILKRLNQRGDDKKEIERRLKDDEIKIDNFLNRIPITKRRVVFNNDNLHIAENNCIDIINSFKLERASKFNLIEANIWIGLSIIITIFYLLLK